MESTSGDFPFFNRSIATFTSPIVGSVIAISSINSPSWNTHSSSIVIGSVGSSLFSTSVHLACISFFSVTRLPLLSRMAVLLLGLSLHSTFVNLYNVLICCFLTASSASLAMPSIHFLLSLLMLLLTSLLFSLYSVLSRWSFLNECLESSCLSLLFGQQAPMILVISMVFFSS